MLSILILYSRALASEMRMDLQFNCITSFLRPTSRLQIYLYKYSSMQSAHLIEGEALPLKFGCGKTHSDLENAECYPCERVLHLECLRMSK